MFPFGMFTSITNSVFVRSFNRDISVRVKPWKLSGFNESSSAGALIYEAPSSWELLFLFSESICPKIPNLSFNNLLLRLMTSLLSEYVFFKPLYIP